MNNEFNLNTASVSNLGSDVAEQARNYINKIDELTSLIDGLSAIWGGSTYDTFKATYQSNLSKISELRDILNAVANNLDTTAADGDTMINNITNIVS